ncbi:hypothetical protein HanIR_Chr05g0250441 [Helianthus annuus]|nr:hypothetical protein HanIR_Chr05g0250441 [Helianthus annuus]
MHVGSIMMRLLGRTCHDMIPGRHATILGKEAQDDIADAPAPRKQTAKIAHFAFVSNVKCADLRTVDAKSVLTSMQMHLID